MSSYTELEAYTKTLEREIEQLKKRIEELEKVNKKPKKGRPKKT